MAEVVLTKLWLHLAADLETSLSFESFEITAPRSKVGGVRVMAGGRRRSVSRPGVSSTIDVALLWITRADRETLEGWIGSTLLLRDPRGRNVWGTFYEVDPIEHPPTEYVTVRFRFHELTVVEAV